MSPTKLRKSPLRNAEKALLRRLGLRIQKELFDQKKTIEWLADKSGVARSTLHEIIAGRSNPRIGTVHSIASALGYSDLTEFMRPINGQSGARNRAKNNGGTKMHYRKPNLKNPVNRRIPKID